MINVSCLYYLTVAVEESDQASAAHWPPKLMHKLPISVPEGSHLQELCQVQRAIGIRTSTAWVAHLSERIRIPELRISLFSSAHFVARAHLVRVYERRKKSRIPYYCLRMANADFCIAGTGTHESSKPSSSVTRLPHCRSARYRTKDVRTTAYSTVMSRRGSRLSPTAAPHQ